jgi:UDP-glucose 4-epimerase
MEMVTTINERKGMRRSEAKILITGGAGFIGSHLTELLLKKGHTVTAIDNLSTGTIDNIRHLLTNPKFKFVRSDISDELVLDRLSSESHIIIHLAAAVGVQLIVERPVHTIETNVAGTEKVLRSAVRYGCKVLIASTSEVYGKGYKLPFSEDDDVLLGPTNKSRWGYAASKMVDEFLGMAYFAEYGLDVVCFRLFNTVGPRQSGQYGMVIPRFVKSALQGKPIEVYGNGNQKRCFGHVYDVIRAIEGLTFHSQAGGNIFNIGSTEEISILELAQTVKRMTVSRSEIVLVPYEQAYAPGFEDMERRIPSITKINKLLGWTVEKSMKDILKDVIHFESKSN